MSFSWQDYNGMVVKLHGVNHRIKVETGTAIYPYKHTYERAYAEPCNKKSKYYLDIMRKLGDDWSVSLTDSFDAACEVLEQL